MNRLHPEAFPLPAALSSPVTQQHVDMLVKVNDSISDTTFPTAKDEKRAALHWLVLYEQLKMKVASLGATLDMTALRRHGASRLRQVRLEEVNEYKAWLEAQKYAEDAIDPLYLIDKWAINNESLAGTSNSGATSGSFNPSTMSGQ